MLAFQIILGIGVLFLLMGCRFIPNRLLGLVEKRWSFAGSIKSGLIALDGEAGYQPEVLRGGWHWRMPLQYRIHTLPLVTIPQGKIGYVFARDGQALPPTQTLASNLTADNFEDVRAFLSATGVTSGASGVSGGQRGPQRKILREGTYAINLAQFVVITSDRLYYLALNRGDLEIFQGMAAVIAERCGFEPVVIRGNDDMLGVVTVHDGPALGDGQIIAPVVGNNSEDTAMYHNNFQDPERFLAAGGRRGRQLQVLVEGTYFVNRLFATVEMIPKTVIEVGFVGVVVSYTGDTGTDLSGVDYRHGELVKRGHRGVWSEALLPGKYAFNTYAGAIRLVPTTNFILKWIEDEAGTHKYDENLSEVGLITKDAFEPWLPLSVVVHIDYREAPLVIQRFGDIRRLVEQTLDPMVSAYFKNVAQTRTLIELIHDRTAIQEQSLKEMRTKFKQYNLQLEEVLIGTPESSDTDQRIEDILAQLRLRQMALEQIETYGRQQQAAVKERELREAEAKARQQQKLTESEINILTQSNEGKAMHQKSIQEAERVRALAQAEADKISYLAQAEADRAAKVGIAQAIAIEEQVRAYGGPQFQLTQQVMNRFAEAIQEARVDVVPKIVIGQSDGKEGQGGMNSGIMQSLMAMMLSDKLQAAAAAAQQFPRDAEVEAMRSQIKKRIAQEKA